MNNTEYAEELRRLADIYEQNPAIPLPYESVVSTLNIFAMSPADAANLAHAFSPVTKEDATTPSFYSLRPTSFRLALTVQVYKENCCRKVEKGTVQVPETVIPATPERVIPAHEETVYEWECGPVLAGGDGDAHA